MSYLSGLLLLVLRPTVKKVGAFSRGSMNCVHDTKFSSVHELYYYPRNSLFQTDGQIGKEQPLYSSADPVCGAGPNGQD